MKLFKYAKLIRALSLLCAAALVGLGPLFAAGLSAEAASSVADQANLWLSSAYIKASNTETGDGFGYSMAVSGDTLAVGAHWEDSASPGVDGNQADNSAVNSGAVYVYTRDSADWAQQAYLKASNPGTDVAASNADSFGWSVAIDGDTLVVGAPREDSAATGVDGNQADNSAPQAGAAYVFVRNAGVWTQQAYLKASNTDPSDNFGSAVAISGDTIVVGAFGERSGASGINGNQASNTSPDAGAVYVFVRTGETWSQQAYIKASNSNAGDAFGWSVGISGDTVVVGAYIEASNATGVNGDQLNNLLPASGAAYVFTRTAGVWSQQAYLKASNTGQNDWFGQAVAVSGDTIVVSAINEDSPATGINGDQGNDPVPGQGNYGAAYIFSRSGADWSQQAYVKASNSGDGDLFGSSVALAGDQLLIGAPYENSSARGVNGDGSLENAGDAGAAYLFSRSGTDWSQSAYLKPSNTELSDFFGWSVALDGRLALVGSRGEDSSATGINGNQADNSAQFAGAAYLFAAGYTHYFPLVYRD